MFFSLTTFFKYLIMFYNILIFSIVVFHQGFGINKCSIIDDECKSVMYHDIAKSLAKGDIERGIPPLDPVKVANVTALLPEVAITLLNGELKGFGGCKMVDFRTDLQLKQTALNLTCNLEFDGQYKIFLSPVLGEKFGIKKVADLEGTGKGKIRIDNYQLSLDFHVYLIKKHEEVYMNVENVDVTNFILGKTVFIPNEDIFVNKDTTDKVTSYINKHSESICNTFGTSSLDKAKHFYDNFGPKHINVLPANYFFSGKLDSFVKQ